MNYFSSVYHYCKALRGNPESQFLIANILSRKAEVECQNRALMWFQAAANQGHKAACFIMAKQEIDAGHPAQAIDHLKNSLPTENGINESLLGQILLNTYTTFVDQQRVEARGLASNSELDQYILSLSNSYQPASKVRVTPETASSILSEALHQLHQGVSKNNPLAKHALAIYILEYKENLSLSDQEEALNYLYQASENNFSPSLQALAGIYENGLYGQKQNIQKGLELRVKAAETGSKEAQFALGILVYKGNGFEKNREQGMKLLHMAAQQGHVEAKLFLDLNKD